MVLQFHLRDRVPQIDVLLHEPRAPLRVLDQVGIELAHPLEDEVVVLAGDRLGDSVAALLVAQVPAENLHFILSLKQCRLKTTAFFNLALKLLLDGLVVV